MYTIITRQAYHNKCCQSEHCSNKQMVTMLMMVTMGLVTQILYIHTSSTHVRRKLSHHLSRILRHRLKLACAFSWVHSMLSECVSVFYLDSSKLAGSLNRRRRQQQNSSRRIPKPHIAHLLRVLVYFHHKRTRARAFTHMNSVQYFRCMQFAV